MKAVDILIRAVAFVWLAATGRRRHQVAANGGAGERVALVQHVETKPVAVVREVAQVQDHGEAPNATTNAVAFVPDDREAPTRPRLLLGPAVDGGTSWSLASPPGGWRGLVRDLRARAKRGAKAVELKGVGDGDVVEVALEQKGGALVLWASSARIEVAGKRVEVQLEARAAWTEGPARWAARVLPLVTWWLLGEEQGQRPGSVWSWLESVGWRQASVEIAMDFVGWSFAADDHKALVTKLGVRPWVQGGQCRAIEFGQRSRNPVSGALYDKGAALAVLRGDPPAGYIERLRAAGWDGEEALTRLELRLQGKALHLVDGATGEVHDFGRPTTAFDADAIGKLASHALAAVWMADLGRGNATQVRDNPVHPGWQVAREAAAGGCEPIKLTRAAVQAEHASVVTHARARLLRAGVDVGVLLGGEGIAQVGELAHEVLGQELGTVAAVERHTASRARYAELLAEIREVGA